MRINTQKTLDERRKTIIDFLEFIRDFNSLDTTLLMDRVMNEESFVEAVESVLSTSMKGPWAAMDALKDFCVQALYGERPPMKSLMERARPVHHRVTPYSIPLSLLKTLVPNPSQFDVHRLSTWNATYTLAYEPANGAFDTSAGSTQVLQNEWLLITSAWARVLPSSYEVLKDLHVHVYSMGNGRMIHRGLLWSWVEDAMPCCWPLDSNERLQVKLDNRNTVLPDPSIVLITLEGWRYDKSDTRW